MNLKSVEGKPFINRESKILEITVQLYSWYYEHEATSSCNTAVYLSAIVHNVNTITKWAGLEQSGYETTWVHGGFGEKVSGITGLITLKPDRSKGGQIFTTINVNRIRPQVYVHLHKIHKRPLGFGKEVPNEDRILCEKIMPLIVGQEQPPGLNRLCKSKPHFTYDNYLSGDSIMDLLSGNRFSAVMTCRLYRLPSNIPP